MTTTGEKWVHKRLKAGVRVIDSNEVRPGVTSNAGFCTTIKSKDSLDRFCTVGVTVPYTVLLGNWTAFSTCRSLSNKAKRNPHGPTWTHMFQITRFTC